MATLLIASVGALDANSYCTLAEANSYHDTRLHNSDWLAATDPNKEKALLWATRLLDTHYDFRGFPVSLSQALRWPRTGIFNRDGIYISPLTIPKDIKMAQMELALSLLLEDRTIDSDTIGLKSLKVDVIQLEFDSSQTKEPITQSVQSLLAPYGTYLMSANTPVNVQLVRG